MAAVRDNLVNKNRISLEEVIPLDMPFSISVDPCNLCNFKCDFCAFQASGRKLNFKKQMMKKEMLQKLVGDIKETGIKLKILRFATNGEPFLNPDLTEMVAYTKKMEIADCIEIVTNGSCFQPDLNEQIVNSGVDRIRISVEAIDAEGYLEIAHYKLDFEKFVDNIADLYERSRDKCEIYIKIVDAAVKTKEQQDRFYKIFENICDKIFIDNIIPLWSDYQDLENKFEIKKAGLHQQQIRKVTVCPYSFYSCVIHPDGDVTVCCADWERKFIVGNISKDKFWDIWHGKKLRNFWINQLEGKRFESELCSKCLLPEYNCNDNIDDKAEMILKALNGEEI